MEQLVQEFEEAYDRAQGYLDGRREAESINTAGTYNPQEYRKEARFDSSKFHNDAERQEELQYKSLNALCWC